MAFFPARICCQTARPSQLFFICSVLHRQACMDSPDLYADEIQVWAVDANQEQLKQCQPHPGIYFREGIAENTGIASGSVDLVTVATALHWCACLMRQLRQRSERQ